LLDIPVDESIKRRLNKKDDRMETEGKVFLSDVSQGFKQLAEENSWKIISALKSKEDIIFEMKYEIKKLSKTQ